MHGDLSEAVIGYYKAQLNNEPIPDNYRKIVRRKMKSDGKNTTVDGYTSDEIMEIIKQAEAKETLKPEITPFGVENIKAIKHQLKYNTSKNFPIINEEQRLAIKKNIEEAIEKNKIRS
jgi:hypothetical protein